MSVLDIETVPITREYLEEQGWCGDPNQKIYTRYFTYHYERFYGHKFLQYITFRVNIVFPSANLGNPTICIAPRLTRVGYQSYYDILHEIKINGDSIETLNLSIKYDYIGKEFEYYMY